MPYTDLLPVAPPCELHLDTEKGYLAGFRGNQQVRTGGKHLALKGVSPTNLRFLEKNDTVEVLLENARNQSKAVEKETCIILYQFFTCIYRRVCPITSNSQ